MPDRFTGWLNPLEIISDDNETHILKCLYGTGDDWVDDIMKTITDKHTRISDITAQWKIPIVPTEDKIMSKMIWPLRSAKIAYCLEHYLECIFLCGIVSEMLVLLIYEILPTTFLKKLDQKYSNKKNGFKFVDYSNHYMGQKKRLEQLEIASKEDEMLEQEDKWAISLLDKLKADSFTRDMDYIRDKRNHYVHSFDLDNSTIEEDAESFYKYTQKGLRHIFDFGINNGMYIFPTYLIVYCKAKGIIRNAELNE